MAGSTLVNVSNRLPVSVAQDGGVTRSSGGLVAALEGLAEEGYALQWIGSPGSEIEPQRQAEIAHMLQTQHGSIPVFLTQQEIEGFYEGFSNTSLWPLLHYTPSYMRYEPGWWEAYQLANRKFADKVLSVARDQDLIWVHDYQLMLVPGMLREANPALRIGFFLHTPFPSYEIFRCHPNRVELLEGLLGADQIGFHTFGYMRHFRSAVLRLLGVESDITRIRHSGHVIHMGIYPIGINAARFEQELGSPAFAEQRAKAAEADRDQRVVLSVERLDYSKGLLRRLDGIDLFLSQQKDRDRIKFIFISVPSRENVEAYQQLREDVESAIGRLNGKYATLTNSPIRFIHGSVNFTELCALYSVADVGMVTPLIDGMNLVAKEYVACQREDPGVLVLSEFAGAAEELFNALTINPYDPRAICEALEEALAMSPQEKARRMHPMRQRVMRFDARWWARSFIDDLASRPPVAGTATAKAPSLGEARDRVAQALSQGKRVALFLDYDGTLREIEREPAAAMPNPAVHRILGLLRNCRGVDVTIISGRRHEDLEAWLGSYPFALIAEHGAAIRRLGQNNWEQLDRNISYAWKEDVLKVLRQFEASTPGSFVEEKRTSLVWHYRKADPEFGGWKAKELADELATLTANEPIQVRHGRKIVEVTSASVNKGAAVARLLEDATYDLALCAGDDLTDETMYRLDVRNMVSIKVGEGETAAQYRVWSPAAFRTFLEQCLPTPGTGEEAHRAGSPVAVADPQR